MSVERIEGAGDRARAERVAQGLPPMVEDESALRRAAAIFSAPIAAPAACPGRPRGGDDRGELAPEDDAA